ncbi:MAG: hypothetical protein ACRDNL_23695 [Spirillospora sp.]
MKRPLVIAVVALGLAAPVVAWTTATAATPPPRLMATVGPGARIALTNAAGVRVRTLKPGSYRITVRDRTARDNFHLSGPGVNRRTTVRFRGTVTWLVQLRAGGVYRYVSDARPKRLRGSFRVTGLVATVGPGFTISLTARGTRVRTLKPGAYALVVRDRSTIHNFHLRGPGVDRQTGVAVRRTVIWRLRLRVGAYRFVCDPHAGEMQGGFRVG